MSHAIDLTGVESYEQQFNAVLSRTSPDWLKKQRDIGFENFLTQGFPHARLEAWKYTNLRLLVKKNFQHHVPTENVTASHEIQFFSLLDENTHNVVLVDGQYQPQLSHAFNDQLVIITSWQQAVLQHPELMEKYLGQAVDPTHALANLAAALAEHGMIIMVPDGVTFEKPVHLLFVTTKNSQDRVMHVHNLFVVGKNARLQVIEHYVDLHDVTYFNNVVSEAILDDGAHLQHYKVEQESNQSFHIAGLHVKQHKDSCFNSHAVTLSGHFSRHDIVTRLLGQGASAETNGLYLVNNTQHVDYHVLIKHEVGHCDSRILYKGILNDRASSVFNGKVHVLANAQKTNSIQGNHNLLLSNNCEANSKPELEIYADDVKCAHGASSGHLDEEALFYLQARGLTYLKARRMLIKAFANDVLEKIELMPLRQYCQRYVEMAIYE